MGIYQAYLTVTITLLLVWLLDDLLFHRRSAAASLRSAGRFLAGGVLAGAVYAVALQLVLAFSGTALSDYQGIDTVGSLQLCTAASPASSASSLTCTTASRSGLCSTFWSLPCWPFSC